MTDPIYAAIEMHARRTEIPCPAHSTLPTYITAKAALPKTSFLSPVTSPLVPYRISRPYRAPILLHTDTITLIGPYPHAVTRLLRIRR